MSKKKPRPSPWQQEEKKQSPPENFTEVGDAPHLRDFIPGLGKDNFFHSTWSSPEKLAMHIEKVDRKKEWTDSGWESGRSFHGTETMEEALLMAKEGWLEGVDQVFKLRNSILAANPMRVQAVRYGIAGSEPSVPRAVAGNIFNMKMPDMTKSKRRPVITLIANMTASCGVSEHRITNRAAAVCAIIDRIESTGFTVEVISTAITKSYIHDGFRAATSVLVKQAGQPVDTARLAYGLGHSSFFRRLVFASWGSEQAAKKLGSGLGHVFEPGIGDLNEKNVYVLPSAGHHCDYFDSEEKAGREGLQMLVQHLANQKCPAFANIEANNIVAKDDVPWSEF